MAKPLAASDGLVRLPASLRNLHALPRFARAPFNTTCTFMLHESAALDTWIQRFRTANLLPNGENEEFFARYAELAAAYPLDDAELVASHNDLFKPDNLLFDGQRLWLVG